ncbi:uncharacterized protein LOC111342433 [Stylophora pistillata]|uniref:uncharacterized protein LOC111342433 n=1 Tax=Stylophora pistillata TaxID=50429 RepID=UPI000C052ACC|nr:uncharacterized protein LOC111342433 [Stylophora pistillata]
MDQTGKGSSRLRFQMLLALLVHFVEETRSAYVSYEQIEYNFTWISALNDSLLENDAPLASIGSIEQLCEAQADLIKNSQPYSNFFWTALRLDSQGSFQWGLPPNNSAQVPLELLDRTQLFDRCYAISKSMMQLKSLNCSRKLPYLFSYNGKIYCFINNIQVVSL